MLDGSENGGKGAEHLWRMRDSPKKDAIGHNVKVMLQRP